MCSPGRRDFRGRPSRGDLRCQLISSAKPAISLSTASPAKGREERQRLVRQQCDGDPTLAREVLKLLEAFESSESFLEVSPVQRAEDGDDAADATVDSDAGDPSRRRDVRLHFSAQSWLTNRSLQDPRKDRRRGNGSGLRRRADRAGSPQGRAESHSHRESLDRTSLPASKPNAKRWR